jgi:hypothetical protein
MRAKRRCSSQGRAAFLSDTEETPVTPYPSIPSWTRAPGLSCYVFDKIDGSHVRCEANRKGQITKFGKRNTLLDDQTPFLRESEKFIPEKYGETIAKIVRDQRWEKAVFFFEFWGAGSFAGSHIAEPHDVTLIDVEVHRRGFLEPREFVKTFKHIDTAQLLHVGNFTKDIADAVSEGRLEGMTFEGVVCKGLPERGSFPGKFKWKSLAWLQKLRGICKDEEEFRCLA